MILLRAGVIVAIAVTLLSCGHNAAKSRQAALQRGQQFYQKGSYGDAEIQFRKAIQEDPRFGDAYYWLGRAEKQRGNFAAAFSSLKQAIALMPEQAAPKVELVNLMLLGYLGDASRPAELYKQISQISQDLLAQDTNSFDGIRIKGYLAMVDEKPGNAIEDFQSANRLKPDEPDVITALVESYFLAKQDSQAEETAAGFLRRKPASGPLYTVIYQHYMGGNRLADAEAILKTKVSRNPKESQYRIELARHYARVRKQQEMKDTLNQLVANAKDFPHAHLDVGDFYADSRNWTEARSQYEQGVQSDPSSKVIYWKRLVRIDLSANEHAPAQQLLEQILKEQPRDREARASQAALRMAGADPQQRKLASAQLKTLVDDYPQEIDYRIEYAGALRAIGDIESARAQYLQVSQRQPKNLAVIEELANLSLQERRMDETLEYAGRALALDPKSVRARLVRSAALASKGQFQETRTILTGLALEHPELREAQFQLALLDVEEKHYAEAEKRFRKYYEPGKPDVRVLEGMVEVYRAQNQLQKAVALLESDLKQSPHSSDVRALLAATAAQAGQNELAVQEYEQLARDQVSSPEVAVQLGLAYQSSHDLPRALAEFERARKLAPQAPLVYAYLGKALDESGRKADAIRSYRQCLSLNDRNPWVLNNLAYLLAETGGDLTEALKLAQEASQQAADDASFTDTVGWVYLKKRDFSSAIHVFESVRDKHPKEVVFRIHLAMALLGSGDSIKARTELKAAQLLPCTQQDKDVIGRLLTQAETA